MQMVPVQGPFASTSIVEIDMPKKHFFQEVHIIHKFDGDLYGQRIDAVILGFLREMLSFKSIG